MPEWLKRGIGVWCVVAVFMGLPPVPCRTVTVTRHDVMSAVLRNKPDRVCDDCDGYIAPFSCNLLGQRYVLVYGGNRYTVKAADCSVWGSSHPKQQQISDWFGDVFLKDQTAHFSIDAPKKVLLCYEGLDP